MKTKEQVKQEIEKLNSQRLYYIDEIDGAKTDIDKAASHQLVLSCAMKQEALEWVLKNDI